MDKIIEKKRWNKKLLFGIAAGICAVAFLIYLLSQSGGKTMSVDSSKVLYGTVSMGDFQEVLPLNGSVEPIRTVRIDAFEGGRVEELFVEDGQMVEADQPLMRLSNTALRLDFMNRETQIIEQINNLRSTRISLDQNKRQVQEQLLDITFQFEESERKFTIDTNLYASSVISFNDFETSRTNFNYLKSKKEQLEERSRTDERYRQSQLQRIDQSIDLMERNLGAIRKNLENLVVRAPISGQLNSFDHEIGDTKARSENLGRVDVLDGFVVSAFVDQHYLNRVAKGQRASYTTGGNLLEMELVKIFPTITNGQFEIQFGFLGETPKNIRRGQTMQVKLEMNAKTKSLIVPRGAFYQNTGGRYVFVVNDNNEAEKRTIKAGGQNPEFIQILEGLDAGEKIIISSYSAFGEAEKVILK